MRPTSLATPAAFAALLATSAAQGSSPSATEGGSKSPDGAPPVIDAPLSIRELMTGPLVTVSDDGSLWVRTRDFRAHFSREAFEVLPVFGKDAPREFPVRFALDEVTVGGDALVTSPIGDPTIEDDVVEIARQGLREVYHLGVDRVEQTFVFDALPAGALRLRLGIETELETSEDAGELRFSHPTFGHVSYGEAYVLDATGSRLALPRAFDGDSITFTVPADFVASAVMPLTIDPVITAFSSSYGVADDSHPDVCFAGGGVNLWYVCWQEYTTSINADVYCTSFTHTGVQGASFAIENSNEYWATPRLAYLPAANRILCVASASPSGPSSFHGTGGAIRGRLISSANSAAVGPPITISSTGTYKSDPDVGGTNYVSAFSNHFIVAWSRHVNTATRFIEYRIIDWDGTAVTPIHQAHAAMNVRAIQPAVSESHGDATLSGDYWTLAWILDSDQDFRGQVWARRVAWNGNPSLGNGTFLVDGSTHNQNPTVTSRFDIPVLGDRPSIIAWDWQSPIFSTPEPHGDIRARVVIDGQAFGLNYISGSMEDYDPLLDQFEPSIATDGRSFVLTYNETYFQEPFGDDHDVFMLSGHIAAGSNNQPVLALAERHQPFGSSFDPEVNCRVAMIRDGNNQSPSDQGMCVYVRETGSNGGRIHGAILDSKTFAGSIDVAIGVQYCDAQPNSFGQQYDDRTGSWLWIRGNGSIAATQDAICLDMPMDSFGYLNCSLSTGNVMNPGGSQGRLCLGGQIGRFVNSIQSSGSNRTFTTSFQPSSLPQPNGPVSALHGETWYFQVWHRDAVNGMATSNFSNACGVTFRQ